MTVTDRLEALREGVRQSLPEVDEIQDPELREKVVEVHALALSETEYERIEDIPPCGVPGSPPMKRGTQADHYRGVARIAIGMADELERVMGALGIDRDVLVAAALCHDVGKAYEFSPRNRARWESEPMRTGLPAVRHPVYGVHLGLLVGLPEPVVHCIGAHSLHGEGAFVEASLETRIVQYADISFWEILEKAGVVDSEPGTRSIEDALMGR
jgi:23S rRNA maturation-related 3'-5' exoribonuclease YhaM